MFYKIFQLPIDKVDNLVYYISISIIYVYKALDNI